MELNSVGHVGPRIQFERNRKGLTKQNLANLVELSTEAIRLIENNSRKPSLDTLVKLAEIFEIPIEDLVPPEELTKLRRYVKQDPNIEKKDPFYIVVDGELIEVLTYRHLGTVSEATLFKGA